MSTILLNTGTASYNDLIANGRTFHVPPYQRDYSWEKEYWEDLWMDILELPKEKYHYMGYLVFQDDNSKSKTSFIIDGQQRFTTLSILCLSALRLLKEWADSGLDAENNQTRITKLTEKFLGNFSTSKLTITPKLILNKNNDDFYKSYLLNHRKPPAIGKLKPSQKRLWGAYEYFYHILKAKIKSQSGEELASLIDDQISNSLIFTTINVSDDLNAYKVFETLNARGVKLSPSDLLKNYLFSKAFESSSAELEETERRWQSINDFLGKSDLPTFLRHYWNSRYELVRISNLYRSIKTSVQSPEEVFDLLDELEQLAPVYSAFENPADPIWNKEQRGFIRSMNLFGVSTWYSLMLIAKQKFTDEEFTKLLHELNVITFRYNVISGLHTNEIELVFNRLSIKIFKSEITTASQSFEILKAIYVSDESFAQAFSVKYLSTKRNKNLVKYILVELENTISGTSYQSEDATSSIEHILPENPTIDWEPFFPADEQEEYIYLIGNYTLLEETLNRKAGDKAFLLKVPFYKTSTYKMSKDELNYTEWTPVILRKHQDKMAKWACSAWKSHYA
ncbi:MAG: DUF262 domain-containing HNH endonuclease family protein [Flavobacterium sp. JAD_PAG50586_2]|nr:MAG: DUF262 domain-containing HNH endonuclease family protein [Flavobacterium sp. JAD_PAG50586_2]